MNLYPTFKNMKNNLSLKFITCAISVLLLLNINTISSESLFSSEDKSLNCYGFVLPLPKYDNISKVPELQYTFMNLINDLLRMNISVYWSFSKLTLEIMEVNQDNFSAIKDFELGTFLVPFTGIKNIDSLISVIIYDYNNSHELFQDDMKEIETYFLMQPLSIENLYLLTEPKLAYFYSGGVSIGSLNWYITPLSKAGFLNNEFFNEDDVISILNNKDFNVILWPGGSFIEYLTSGIGVIKRFHYLSVIKEFVRNGGGFIGSCLGAYVVSSGMRFLPLNLLLYNFPRLPSIFFMRMQDCLITQGFFTFMNISIQDNNHPVTIGVDKIIYNSQFRFGGTFSNLGENTKSLGKVHSVNSSWFRWLSSMDNSILGKIYNKWLSSIIGETVWTTSDFGKGKIVTFGDHPEIGDANLHRVFHNSIFYTTSKMIDEITFHEHYIKTLIENQFLNSQDLKINNISSDFFDTTFKKIENTSNQFQELVDIYYDIVDTIEDLVEHNKMNNNIRSRINRGGLNQFYSVILRVIGYLDDLEDKKDSIHYLKQIDSIIQMLFLKNYSFFDELNNLKDNIEDKIDSIKDDILPWFKILNQLKEEIDNYQNTEIQNDYIFELIKKLEDNLMKTDFNSLKINFNSLRFLRKAWYTYESLEIS